MTQHKRGELFGAVDFVSNVGGLMGLFLGFSAISLMEVVFYLGKVMFNWAIFNNGSKDGKEGSTSTSWVAKITGGKQTTVTPFMNKISE